MQARPGPEVVRERVAALCKRRAKQGGALDSALPPQLRNDKHEFLVVLHRDNLETKLGLKYVRRSMEVFEVVTDGLLHMHNARMDSMSSWSWCRLRRVLPGDKIISVNSIHAKDLMAELLKTELELMIVFQRQ